MRMNEQLSFWNENNEPLAERLRPTSIAEIVGQDHLLGKGKILRNMIDSDNVRLALARQRLQK